MADRCSFCGSTAGPFSSVEGLFTVLMYADCQTARGRGSGPYPVMTRAEMRAGLDLMATWALGQKAAANRQLIAAMRRRLAAGEQVARMYQEPGLTWLEPQAEVVEELVTSTEANNGESPRIMTAWVGRLDSTSPVSSIRVRGRWRNLRVSPTFSDRSCPPLSVVRPSAADLARTEGTQLSPTRRLHVSRKRSRSFPPSLTAFPCLSQRLASECR